MLRYLLFGLLCVCFFTLIYIAYFKKDATQARLEAIEKNALELASESTNSQKERKNLNLSFLHIPQKVQDSIVSAGIMLRVEEYVLIWITLTFIPSLLYYSASGNFWGSIVLVFIGVAIPPIVVSVMKTRRLNLFGVQLGDALLLISNGLRAGFSFEQVIENVAKDMPNPISQEFSRVSRELRMGLSLENSLSSLTERMENTDLRLLTSAVLIQRQVGGNLADILDTISITIQDRIKIKNHIRSMTAQGKISGLIVGSIPIFLFITISMSNPEYTSMFTQTTFGIILLVIAITMELMGFLIIRKMINLKV